MDYITEHLDELVSPQDDSGSDADVSNDSDEDSASERSGGGNAGETLAELMLELSLAFWTQRERSASASTLAIVYFSGVLGIHPETLMFPSANSYTPSLTPLLWVGRIFLLELCPALPALLLEWTPPSPKFDEMQDSLIDRSRGASFLTRNGFQYTIRPIQERAYSDDARYEHLCFRYSDMKWRRGRVNDHFRLYERFQAILLTAMHYTGGMPSCGTQITTLLHQNTSCCGVYQNADVDEPDVLHSQVPASGCW
jgi:hypothetical protein